MFYVEEIVFKFCFCFFYTRPVLILYLSPATDSRTNRISQGVKWCLTLQHATEHCAFWARPDKTHLAPQYIDCLRELVQSQLANDATHASDALIAVGGPLWTVFFSILIH